MRAEQEKGVELKNEGMKDVCVFQSGRRKKGRNHPAVLMEILMSQEPKQA
jgi:hypothetical protein